MPPDKIFLKISTLHYIRSSVIISRHVIVDPKKTKENEKEKKKTKNKQNKKLNSGQLDKKVGYLSLHNRGRAMGTSLLYPLGGGVLPNLGYIGMCSP